MTVYYIMIATMSVVFIVALFMLFRLFKKRDRMYDVVYFDEHNHLVMNNAFKTRYAIDTIDHVKLSYRSKAGNYSGSVQVILKNGKKSRTFYFDGSVVTKKMTLWTSYNSVLQAINEVEAIIANQYIWVKKEI